ncbi:MAG: sterol desaturase family protein [Oligoflexia bacterium]|nr:sterol desaturase family protein [Oligoflexia bacterium]
MVFFIIKDFFAYLHHRFVHLIPSLYYFHAVHHSPKNISFYTYWRMHPIDYFGNSLFKLFGIFILMKFCKIVYGQYLLFEVVYATVFVTIISSATNFLRHSTFILHFPRWLSHIIQSPAMHLSHHNLSEDKQNKNFAVVFSFWDWILGTIYIPTRNELTHKPYGIDKTLGFDELGFIGLLLHPFKLLLTRPRRL